METKRKPDEQRIVRIACKLITDMRKARLDIPAPPAVPMVISDALENLMDAVDGRVLDGSDREAALRDAAEAAERLDGRVQDRLNETLGDDLTIAQTLAVELDVLAIALAGDHGGTVEFDVMVSGMQRRAELLCELLAAKGGAR